MNPKPCRTRSWIHLNPEQVSDRSDGQDGGFDGIQEPGMEKTTNCGESKASVGVGKSQGQSFSSNEAGGAEEPAGRSEHII